MGLTSSVHSIHPCRCGPLIGALTNGARLDIIAGPTCGDGLRRWQVRYDFGTVGWVADGQGSQRWLQVVTTTTTTPSNPTGGQTTTNSDYYRCGDETYPPDGCITGADPLTAQIIFVNGIQNDLSGHNQSRDAVSQIFGGNVMGIYNSGTTVDVTHGQAYTTLVRYLESYVGDVTLVGHSQGGAIIAEALNTVAQDMPSRLDRISVYTFGSPARSYPLGPRFYLHVTFLDDMVTYPVRAFVDFCIIPNVQSDLPFPHYFNQYLFYFRDYCN